MFGIYMVLLSAAYLVGGIAVFGTDRVLVRETASSQDIDKKKTLLLVGRWGMARVLLFSMIGFVLVYLWFHSRWANTGYNDATGIWVASLLVPASVSTIIVAAFLTGMGNVKISQAINDPIRNSFLLLCIVFALYFGTAGEIRVVFVAQIVSFLMASIVGWKWLQYKADVPSFVEYWLTQPRSQKPAPDKIKKFRISSWYFFLGTAGTLILNRVDILVVNALSDATVAGYYGAAVRVGQLAAIVILAGSVWLQPKIAQYVNAGDRSSLLLVLKQGSAYIIGGTTLVVICLFVWADFIVSWLGPGFEVVAIPLRLVGLGYLVWAVALPLYAFLLMAGGETVIARILWTQVFTNLSLHFMLVPAFGVVGAAWAWTGGMIIISAITLWCGLHSLHKYQFR